MPVCDARTQNGDRAFLHMVIENIFISGFRKSDPYYVITVLLRNIGYYRVTKFLFKINRAERLTCEDVSTNGQALGDGVGAGARLPRGTGGPPDLCRRVAS